MKILHVSAMFTRFTTSPFGKHYDFHNVRHLDFFWGCWISEFIWS